MGYFLPLSGRDTKKFMWCGIIIYVAYAQSNHGFQRLGSISTSDVCEQISGIKTITVGLFSTV